MNSYLSIFTFVQQYVVLSIEEIHDSIEEIHDSIMYFLLLLLCKYRMTTFISFKFTFDRVHIQFLPMEKN